MKFQSSIVSAAALFSTTGISAWAPSTLAVRHQTRWMSTINAPLQASVMAEGEAELVIRPADIPTETLMARGSVVSFFRGGLAAVKIDEEDFVVADENATPSVLSPTKVPNMQQKTADAGGGDLVGHRVVFPNGQEGVVVAHRPPIAFVYNGLDSFEGQEGKVSILKEYKKVAVGEDRKAVGWDGTPISSESNKESTIKTQRAMFAPIPQVKDIALINNPMLTGNTMVDVLAPIGRGQNMLLAADDLQAARGMVCDFISTQKQTGSNTKLVYAAIDNSADVMEKLKMAGLEDDVHVVMSEGKNEDVEAAAKSAEAVSMAASACAIAEAYALEEGLNSVVIVDTLDQHKKLWDATTRVLVDVFGVDSVVKSDREGGASSEMRGFFSAIVQRAGQYKKKRGGGSVTIIFICGLPKLQGGDENTVFSESDFENGSEKVKTRIQLLVKKGVPLTAATLRKIDIPVPSAAEGQRRLVLQHIDDLISMSDGQIWLDESLREAGQFPPIDPQRSITRVGIGADTESRADAPALRRIAEGLRLDLSQAANMEGAEDTNASKKQLRRRKALLLAMHQVEGQGGRSLSQSCVVLLAASHGLLDAAVDSGKLAGTAEGQQVIDELLDHVQKVAPTAMATIDQSLDLEPDVRKEVLGAIESFFEE